MKYSLLILLLSLIFTLGDCELVSPEKKEDPSAMIGLVALARGSSSSSPTSSGSQKFPTPNCEVLTPAFSTLKDAGFESTCGQSGCHITGGTSANKFRANTYSEVVLYASSGAPSSSSLYNVQSSGSMAQYTTQAIDKAIYCWILGGTKP